MPIFPVVRHISVSVDRPPAQVYAFAVDPEHLPLWANGLSDSIEQVNDEWIAESPMGKVKLRFAERNAFGVLDHEVILESGVTVHNPMRVIANGDGSEVVFTLFRRPDVSEEDFAADAEAVEKDLTMLRRLLEAR